VYVGVNVENTELYYTIPAGLSVLFMTKPRLFEQQNYDSDCRKSVVGLDRLNC